MSDYMERVDKMEIKPYMRKTHYYETDQMGIIHHANYIHWFEEARVDFMDQIGFSYARVVDAGIEFGLLGVACEYKSMVRFNDIVQIHVYITALTPVRATIRYEIFDALTNELRTTGESKHFFYDSVQRRPTSLQKKLPEVYEVFSEILARV